MSPSEVSAHDIVSGLLQMSGCHSIIHSEATGHINSSCPFASVRHSKGTDNNPSFSVNLEPPFLGHCFSCKTSGPLAGLMVDLSRRTCNGPLYNAASALLSDLGTVEIEMLLHKVETAETRARDNVMREANGLAQETRIPYDVFDESQIEDYAGKLPKYATRRGITIEIAKRWGLGYDKHEVNPRLTFPVRDKESRLVGLVGRKIRETTKQKYYNYWNFPKGTFLYGMHLISSDWVIVVEGMIDTVILDSYDFPVVGLMGSRMSNKQEELLSEFKRVYLAFDGDEEGYRGLIDAEDRLKARVILFRINVDAGKDPKDYTKEEMASLVENASLVL